MKRIKLSPAKYVKLCQEVLDRDRFCQFCGTPNNLTPAHIIRRSQGGDDSLSNLMCACIRCHGEFDRYERGLPARAKERLTDAEYKAYLKTRKINP